MNNKQLIKKLENACVVCRDCGLKYGVYSVGCSSVWEGKCGVCDQIKPVTETRDYGYLMTGIRKLLKEETPAPQPKKGDMVVCAGMGAPVYTHDGENWVEKEKPGHMLTQEPIMTDENLDRVMNPSHMQGDIECKFTEEEIGFLHECLDVICENHESLCAGHSNEKPEDVALFESIEKKITELYEDHCVKYELSPAMKKYHELYGTFGFESELDTARWEGFRAGFREGEEG